MAGRGVGIGAIVVNAQRGETRKQVDEIETTLIVATAIMIRAAASGL